MPSTPIAASVLFASRTQYTQNQNKDGTEEIIQRPAKPGDELFKLELNSSLEVLRILEGYTWPHDDTTDIGLTLDKGFPRLGVLTNRHLDLAMKLNCHVRCHLRGYHWSTITIDKRMIVPEQRKGQQRKMSVLLTMGRYTEGIVYTTDGSLQLDSTTSDSAHAVNRQYAAQPPRGYDTSSSSITTTIAKGLRRKTTNCSYQWDSMSTAIATLVGKIISQLMDYAL